MLLDPSVLAANIGWRVCFFIGAALGLGILFVRRHLPESPRWLFTHGKAAEADRIVDDIERQVRESSASELEDPGDPIEVRQRPPVGFVEVARVVSAITRAVQFLVFRPLSAATAVNVGC